MPLSCAPSQDMARTLSGYVWGGRLARDLHLRGLKAHRPTPLTGAKAVRESGRVVAERLTVGQRGRQAGGDGQVRMHACFVRSCLAAEHQPALKGNYMHANACKRSPGREAP